jgi:hypothetical protein
MRVCSRSEQGEGQGVLARSPRRGRTANREPFTLSPAAHAGRDTLVATAHATAHASPPIASRPRRTHSRGTLAVLYNFIGVSNSFSDTLSLGLDIVGQARQHARASLLHERQDQLHGLARARDPGECPQE